MTLYSRVMKFLFLIFFILSGAVHARGSLLLIGGGNKSQEILKEMSKLASGKILIIPLASSFPDEVAASAKSQLENVGATEVRIFSCDKEKVDREVCLSEISNSNLIYFTGGSQNQLLEAFRNSVALKLIQARFEKNLHLAGTSAGTAIMSEFMITGDALSPYERLEGVRQNMVGTAAGFGFTKKYLLDQHFLKRSRQDRLLSAVLDHPQYVGLGIDESTAVLINEDESFTVLGDSLVTVMDARHALIQVLPDGTYVYQNVSVSLLAPGSTFKLP